MPATEHSAEILAGSWPAQSVMSWSGYAMDFSQAANRLFKELDTQADIKDILGPMEGAFIDSARGLAMGRETALQNRIEAYRHISKKSHWAANELHSTKSDLVEIVKQAEENIKTSRENAEKAKAVARANPLAGEPAVAAIESQLQSSIAAIVALAKSNAMARDSQGAGTVTALSTDISQWAAPFVNHILPQTGGIPDMGGLPAAPAPAAPASPGGIKPVDYTSTGDSLRQAAGTENAQNAANNTQGRPENNVQQTAFKQPDKIEPHEAGKQQTSSPPAASAPSSPSPSSAGSSGNPSSVLGQMMKPASSGSSSSSPASSSSSASSGASNPAAASQSSQMANANGANAGAGTGTGANAAANAAGRAGMASLGSGIADTSAKMASGAVNAASNAMSTAANVGSNVAQNVAHAAAQAPAAASPGAVTTPASVGGAPVSGGAPMGGMMPAAPAGGVGAVNPVTSGGGAPSAPAATPTSPAASPVGGGVPQATAAGAAGSSYAPVAVPHSLIRGIGADGATGDVIFDQAMDAGHDVVKALVAQTLGTGYIDIHYAVSLIWERGGTISAWMATSEGASYIPLGVRVPQDVRLSITDPIIGHELTKTSAEAGGANPLEIVVRQAEAREQAAPGARVLALASSLPMDRVMDWAGMVGARPVSVNPKEVDRATGTDMSMLHRCAVAMPWEWRQANAFSEDDRLRVAARHMHMAANAGHLGGGAAERVIELFEERQPIPEPLWADVAKQRFMALIGYQSAMSNAGQGGAEPPARLLASARAAEVVLCLRDYGSAEGCADLLYASRLAGAPLSPAAAVA
ncbi:hypothetical protein BEL07_25535 [Mycolicibacterium grossiae]|uniref:Uncharacterized protein n=2 Tax=Mycolicibacterium grossiae TaxID=1552759 RepID=A0A1E8PX71_9MYCO|nr:hypothetical protein BEL07_25535 [Mycolicibacterium grossiae]